MLPPRANHCADANDIREQRQASSALLEVIPPSILGRLESSLYGVDKRRQSLIHQSSTSIIRLLQSDMRPVIADSHERVAVLFTDVRGFTAWTASHDYSQVFDFLFEMCTKFDEAIARHKVTKIEVIGDAYFVVANCPEKEVAEPERRLLRCAFDMLNAMKEIRQSHGGLFDGLTIRVGVHVGPSLRRRIQAASMTAS